MVADVLSIFIINGNQKTTQDSNYIMGVMAEINDTKEKPEIIFPLQLKLISQYQQKPPSIMSKYKTGK